MSHDLCYTVDLSAEWLILQYRSESQKVTVWSGSRILALDRTESGGNVKSGRSISGRAECGSVVPGLYLYN